MKIRHDRRIVKKKKRVFESEKRAQVSRIGIKEKRQKRTKIQDATYNPCALSVNL